jgi:hypothetical protein
MSGVPSKLDEHRIDVNEGSKPIKQRLRRFSPDKKEAIKKKITKLMAAGFIREILHPDWLASPILVQKKNTAEMAHVRRLHGSQQTLSKGPVRITMN